ncbi:hypothetical protein, partial [Proteus faecis]|uniref:hypothetical protein n=1 Tax=Proteus faecis TaxID=2050967 RepID=UPI003075C0B7
MENGQLPEAETYLYHSASQRMTKMRGRKTANGNLEKVTTHYLPNVDQWEVSTRSVVFLLRLPTHTKAGRIATHNIDAKIRLASDAPVHCDAARCGPPEV